MRIALLYGGRSGEHEISIRSARSIYSALKKTHHVYPIFIDKQGFWWRAPETDQLATNSDNLTEKIFVYPGFADPALYTSPAQLKIDIAFPVLHGTHGEDGIIQGVLECAGIPYVGAGVSASASGMDKAIMKSLFERNKIPVAAFLSFSRSKWQANPDECLKSIEESLPYPVFVKPANLGSSVGISKAHNRKELQAGITDAARYDAKIIVEKGIRAREIECSVLGNEDAEASLPGEIIPKREFYDYIAKYVEDTTELKIPAKLEPSEISRVQELSVAAFRAIGCSGMARVDLLLEQQTGTFYVNEINTIPGFTNISMYPKLWEVSGLPFPQLLDRLLELGLQRFSEQKQNVTSYDLIKEP